MRSGMHKDAVALAAQIEDVRSRVSVSLSSAKQKRCNPKKHQPLYMLLYIILHAPWLQTCTGMIHRGQQGSLRKPNLASPRT